jgi:hypothetical protein
MVGFPVGSATGGSGVSTRAAHGIQSGSSAGEASSPPGAARRVPLGRRDWPAAAARGRSARFGTLGSASGGFSRAPLPAGARPSSGRDAVAGTLPAGRDEEPSAAAVPHVPDAAVLPEGCPPNRGVGVAPKPGARWAGNAGAGLGWGATGVVAWAGVAECGGATGEMGVDFAGTGGWAVTATSRARLNSAEKATNTTSPSRMAPLPAITAIHTPRGMAPLAAACGTAAKGFDAGPGRLGRGTRGAANGPPGTVTIVPHVLHRAAVPAMLSGTANACPHVAHEN